MAVDKNKIIAEATRLVQKGQYDKALKAYDKILAEDRKEVRILLKVGEIQQKKGDNAAAAGTFNQVAEIYGDQGFFLKAVAVYKQIVKLAPDDIRVNEKLAGLYQQLGLLNDATNQLQAVAAAHEKAGDQGRHLDVLRRLLDLDPENIVTCQRLGDLYAKAGRTAEALELYRRASTHLRENKRGDEHLKLAERIFLLTPDDLKLARELAQEYLARGDTKKALGKLQACHGADKQDIDTLRLMAQAFRDLGQVSKTIAVYRALAHVYAERGRREESALTWRMVLDLLPDDLEATEELTAPDGPRVATAAAAPPVGRPPGAGPAAPPPVEGAIPSSNAAVAPVGPPLAPPAAATSPAATTPPAATPISRLLTETDVYLKYGLHQKALDHIQKILAEDAENPDALERIRDIRDAMGDRQGAADAAERALQALLARGGEGRIEHAIVRLRELDPSRADLPVVHADVPVEEVEVIPPEASESELEPATVGEDEPPMLVPDDEAPPMAQAPPVDDAPVVESVLEVEVAPSEPAETVVEQPEEADLAGVEEVEAEEILPEAVSAPPPLPERVSPRLEAELEEVEFYERQGLFDEALLAVRDLAAAHPDHPEVERAKARIEGLVGPEAEPLPVPGAEPVAPGHEPYASTGITGIFDLGPELAAELGPDLAPTPTGEFQYSVADVFEQFKRGLEKTVRPEDSATKYDLGIAFQEMGMLDEALEQFRSALAGGERRREVEILNMIGVCLGMKGDHREAVETYRRALESEFLDADGAKALQFELGAAHEALGEPENALWYYQEIAQADPGFRGTGERVARLGGGPGTPPDGGGRRALGSDAGANGGGAADTGAPEPGRRPGRKNVRSR
jgi:tetratricopeptide (TPR) repeat protein